MDRSKEEAKAYREAVKHLILGDSKWSVNRETVSSEPYPPLSNFRYVI